MKAKVLISFNDKYTGKQHKCGDIIDVAPARFNEITRKGKYVEAYDETAEKAEKTENKTENK